MFLFTFVYITQPDPFFGSCPPSLPEELINVNLHESLTKKHKHGRYRKQGDREMLKPHKDHTNRYFFVAHGASIGIGYDGDGVCRDKARRTDASSTTQLLHSFCYLIIQIDFFLA